MIVTIITLFPEMFDGVFSSSIVKRAIKKRTVTIRFVNIRDFASDSYKTVDGHPYGGGPGMILRVDVVERALQHAKSQLPSLATRTILLDPQGVPYTQNRAKDLTQQDNLILICGHYEGIDERIRSLVDEEISIGDFILTGGEIPAMTVVDSIVRLLPGVLKKEKAIVSESFENNMLEYPQYTRPEVYKRKRVPGILLSGNHAKIAVWRENQAQKRTKHRRPDLLSVNESSRCERILLHFANNRRG